MITCSHGSKLVDIVISWAGLHIDGVGPILAAVAIPAAADLGLYDSLLYGWVWSLQPQWNLGPTPVGLNTPFRHPDVAAIQDQRVPAVGRIIVTV